MKERAQDVIFVAVVLLVIGCLVAAGVAVESRHRRPDTVPADDCAALLKRWEAVNREWETVNRSNEISLAEQGALLDGYQDAMQIIIAGKASGDSLGLAAARLHQAQEAATAIGKKRAE